MGSTDKKVKISVKKLRKCFDDLEVLKDISTEVYEGEVVVILGPSGSGKSTFLRCLNRLEDATAGTIIVDDVDITAKKVNMNKVRENIGMVFQHFNLFNNMNVLDNLMLAPLELKKADKKEAEERARAMLKRVDLLEKADAYPSQLSGGQKQRVAIARAMSTNPKVLLCDEATSALDPNTTKSILELLKKINRELGITVIVITHEMAVIESICDRVAIIDHSHIAESGKVSEIFSGPKSEIGRQLILGETVGQKTSFARARQIRVIFNGQESSEPIISNMVLACKAPVNILLADTHDIGGKAMGQMLLQLPEDEVDAGRICNYLKTVGVTYEEVR